MGELRLFEDAVSDAVLSIGNVSGTFSDGSQQDVFEINRTDSRVLRPLRRKIMRSLFLWNISRSVLSEQVGFQV